jgi:hypothetical protein
MLWPDEQTTHLLARSLGLVAPQSRFACLALAVSRRPRDAHHGHLPGRVHTSIDIIDAHQCASLRHARGRCDAGCCVRGACQRPREMMSCRRVCWVRVLRALLLLAVRCRRRRVLRGEGQGCRDVLWRKLGFASGADERAGYPVGVSPRPLLGRGMVAGELRRMCMCMFWWLACMARRALKLFATKALG